MGYMGDVTRHPIARIRELIQHDSGYDIRNDSNTWLALRELSETKEHPVWDAP